MYLPPITVFSHIIMYNVRRMPAKAQALVATCMDLRFQQVVHEWLEKNKLYGKHDRVAMAGCVKDREILMSQVRTSVKLHGTQKIYLFNHEDCGAYEDRGFANKALEKEAHGNDLKNTKAALKAEFPQLTINTYFISLDGKINKVA